jgi:SAM-dependent methyltransferase
MSGNAAAEFYNANDPVRWGRPEMPEAIEVTRTWLARSGLRGPVLELGCGPGALAELSDRYVGLDLSLPALASFSAARINGDMEQLPIATASVAFVFSWAAIEHVPNPERVLAEVERILRPGGMAVLSPAWNCRSWAAEGLAFRAYAQLEPWQRVRKATLPLRDALWWRAMFAVPRRIFRELRGRAGPVPFDYIRLDPNLTEYIGTDCDAFTSMDPHAAILYFATRGWRVLSHPTARARMLSKHEPVVVEKPAGTAGSVRRPSLPHVDRPGNDLAKPPS